MSRTSVLCAPPHTHPDPPFSSTCPTKAGPGPGGWATGTHPPLPLLSRFLLYFARNRALILSLPSSSPRRPIGGGGLPLPAAAAAAPLKTMKPRDRRPTSQNQWFQRAKITFRLHERQGPSCEGPKCLIFPPTDEHVHKSIKNQ